jgi:hypothetical protein
MQDSDIRKILHSYLKKKNEPIKDTIIIDEFDLCSGLSRIDVAVINGVIHGYEIKSEEDTLKRLPLQMNYYNKSLEKISVATNRVHLKEIKRSIPKWWGLILIDEDNKRKLNEIRKAKKNPSVEKKSLLQLLWKEELFSIMQKYNVKVNRSSNKNTLQENIADVLEMEIIAQEVRTTLKSRQNWRS